MSNSDDSLFIRGKLSPNNAHRFRKLKGELECDSNEEALNEIIKELDRRLSCEIDEKMEDKIDRKIERRVSAEIKKYIQDDNTQIAKINK